MERVAVIIPVYKLELTKIEILSLNKCLEIFTTIPIIFILPIYFKPDYLANVEDSRKKYFKSTYFEDILGYNKLMLSIDFYKSFIEFEYILIYQLDAFVFKNEIDFWCDKEFDYIGAPWFENENISILSGNGGFSLRKIKTFIDVLNHKKIKMKSFINFFNVEWTFFEILRHIPNILKRYLSIKNTVGFFCEHPKFNEDYFFSRYGTKINRNFKVADPRISVSFAFEVNPEKLFDLNNQVLPFGCHAFQKYQPDFWKKFIPFADL